MSLHRRIATLSRFASSPQMRQPFCSGKLKIMGVQEQSTGPFTTGHQMSLGDAQSCATSSKITMSKALF